MKIFNWFLIVALFIFSASALNARENPFIPTKSYVEKKAEIIDDSYSYQLRTVTKKETAPKPIAKPRRMINENMLKNGKHNFLSFVIIEVSDETLSITTHNQLIKKFDLNYKGTRKIVFDFKSSKGFYTKKAYLSSQNFKHIAIGAHPKKGYYRITIDVEDIPSNYDVVYEDNAIHIMKADI